MNPVKLLLKMFALGLLVVAFAACSPKQESSGDTGTDTEMTAPQSGEERTGATGCCQQTSSSCTGPVTESECTDMNGTFREGQSCDASSGECGDSSMP